MLLLTLLACLSAVAWAGPRQELQSKLLLAMRSSRDLQQDNPSLVMQCFNVYEQASNLQRVQYEQALAACQNTSQLQIDAANESFKPVVSSLGGNANSACQLIDNCSNQVDSVSALACFSDVGLTDAKSMFNISSSASQYYSQLQQRLQMIQFTKDQCSNTSTNTFEINSEKEFLNLQLCMSGNQPLTSTTTTEGTTASTPIDSSSVPVPRTTTSIPIGSSSSTPDSDSATNDNYSARYRNFNLH